MKRSIRVLAVIAPLLGLGGWNLWQDMLVQPLVSPHPYHDPQSPSYGRSRDLPASGPVVAPDEPMEMAIPAERAAEMLPGIDMHRLQQRHAIARS